MQPFCSPAAGATSAKAGVEWLAFYSDPDYKTTSSAAVGLLPTLPHGGLFGLIPVVCPPSDVVPALDASRVGGLPLGPVLVPRPPRQGFLVVGPRRAVQPIRVEPGAATSAVISTAPQRGRAAAPATPAAPGVSAPAAPAIMRASVLVREHMYQYRRQLRGTGNPSTSTGHRPTPVRGVARKPASAQHVFMCGCSSPNARTYHNCQAGALPS